MNGTMAWFLDGFAALVACSAFICHWNTCLLVFYLGTKMEVARSYEALEVIQ